MPTLLTASGPISRPIYKLAALVGSCPAWWSAICGLASAEEGFERIHWPEASDVPLPDSELPADARPRAIIEHAANWQAHTNGEAGAPYLSGALRLSLEVPIPGWPALWPDRLWPQGFWPEGFWPESDRATRPMGIKNEKTWLTNRLGALLLEMFRRRSQDPGAGEIGDGYTTHLNITRVSDLEPPLLVDAREYNGNYFGAVVWLVEWKGSDG